MRFQALLGAALTATALFIATQGCSSTTEATGGVHCTPGANVFCRCTDRAPGTKPCLDDGVSFGTCTTGNAGECVGGEDLTDPGMGKPVEVPPVTEPVEPSGTAVDSCPGKPTSVGTAEIIIEGDTTGAKDKAKGKVGACAAGGGGPDHIYHLQPTGSGSLQIKVQGLGAMNPTVYLRAACDDEASQLKCGETTGAGGAESFQHNVLSGHDYYLVVDGASGSAGKYAITMKLTPGPFCGDGKVDTNEACDDTNNVDGDGCSAGCNAVNGDPTSGGGCPGQAVHLWPGKTVLGSGSTVPYSNAFTKTGTSCLAPSSATGADLNAAPDHVYAVTAHAAGNLKVTLTPEAAFNAMLVARKTCTDPTSQTGENMCANAVAAGGVETMTFPVTANQTVFVAAEGALNAKGTYTIKFELP